MTSRPEAALWLLLLAGCGGGETTLTLINEQMRPTTGSTTPGSAGTPTAELDITAVAYRPCANLKWSASEPAPDFTQDVPPEGVAPIPFGESRVFTLVPGCWDFLAVRGPRQQAQPGPFNTTASARVILNSGESATWVPFRIMENEVWW